MPEAFVMARSNRLAAEGEARKRQNRRTHRFVWSTDEDQIETFAPA